MMDRSRKLIGIIIFLGIMMLLPQLYSTAYAAEEENSGRKVEMVTGHASADDNEHIIQLDVGETRHFRINPRAIYAKGIDKTYTYISLALSDDMDEVIYDKNYAKAKKGYKLETTSGDSSIVKIISGKYGYFEMKAVKEGITVIRFYEIYKGVRSYLGCRTIYVGNTDITEDTITLFVGSPIIWPSGWRSQNFHDYNSKKETTEIDIPENKALFKKDTIYYATKPGKTKVTAQVNGKKRTFWANIVEPFISENAKLDYTFYAGYEINFNDNFYLFDYVIYEEYLKLVSDNDKVVAVKGNSKIVTNNPGTANIKVYFEYAGKSKYLGEMKLTVLSSPFIRMTETIAQIGAGNSFQFKADTIDIDDSIKWSVSNPNIAFIDELTGLLTANYSGNITVTAAAGNKKVSRFVAVIENTKTRVREEGEFVVGEKEELRIAGSNEAAVGEVMIYTAPFLGEEDAVNWSLSDENKAMIIGSGKTITLVCREVGTVILYADTATAHGEQEITITPIGMGGEANITVGASEFYFINSTSWGDLDLKWETSDDTIISIQPNDFENTSSVIVLALSPGTAVLTAYNEYGARASITITVDP